jgi:hypothetical protein
MIAGIAILRVSKIGTGLGRIERVTLMSVARGTGERRRSRVAG